MNKIFILTFFMGIFNIFSQSPDVSFEKSIYDFTVKDIYGEDFKFEKLKGKKIMIVNTASKCGLTPQFEGLEDLYKTYKDDNFVIIGFPANNFLWQEPGSNDQIESFCRENYGVTFPMMSKISVKGSSMHPIYKFLTNKERNGVLSSSVSWNFQKYLVGPDRKLIDYYYSTTDPLSKKITRHFE